MNTYIYENEKGEKINFSPTGEIIALNVEGLNGHDVDIKETQNVNQIGATYNTSTVKSKPIAINGVIRGNITHNRKLLLKVIRPQLKGYFHVITDTRDVYTIEVIPKQTPIIGFGNYDQNFQITLHAPFPYWKKNESQHINIRKLIPLFRFPRSFAGTWKLSEYQRSEFINVENKGNEKVGMKITLKASQECVNPKLLNVQTGEYIKLNYTMSIDEVITITTGYSNKRVVSNIKGNIFKNLDLINSTFLQLDVGDNIFKFTADEKAENVEVVVYFDEVVNGI